MNNFVKAAAAAMALTASTIGAAAQDWTPPGPIKLMIAFAAGGGADTQARLIAEDLEAELGWNFIPEQVTGKGGLNLAMAIKDEPADGTVIGMVVAETLGYNMYVAEAGVTPEDFTAITTTAGFQMGIVARAEKGWTDFADVLAAAKGGEAIRFGTMSDKLSDLAYLLGRENGTEFNIVQVRGGRDVLNGVNAGDMDLGFMAGIQTAGVASGELVNLASALSTPLEQTPDAPMMSAFGVDYNADGYFMFIGPAGMPDAVRAALARAIEGVVTRDGSKSNGMITKAFGGPAVLQGEVLDGFLAAEWAAAEALLAEASQ